MASITRLITVQGPLQLVTALAVLFSDRDKNPAMVYEDILVIHGTCVGDDYELINAAMFELAKVWKWHKVISLHRFEHELNKGAYHSRQAMHEAIYAELGLRTAGVIWAVRNWQITNELLLEAFCTAHKVTYGDGMGQIDSYASPPNIPFDEAITILPIRLFSYTERPVVDLNQIPHTVIARDYVLQVIAKFLEISDRAREMSANIGRQPDKTIIVIFKNGTESRLTQFEKEIAIMLNAIVRVAAPGDRILLKPHPRETFSQSALVQDLLKKLYQLDSEIIGKDDFVGHLPLEVFMYGNSCKRVLSPLITGTSRQLKFLYGIEVDERITPDVYGVLNPVRRYHQVATEHLNTRVEQNLDTWDGVSLVYNWTDETPEEIALKQRDYSVSTFWPTLLPADGPVINGLVARINGCAAAGDRKGVISCIREATVQPPNNVSLLCEFAQVAEKLDELELARRLFEIATICDPRCHPAHEGLARISEMVGRAPEALIARSCAVAVKTYAEQRKAC